MIETHKAILSVDCLYVVTGNDIHKYKQKYKSYESIWKRLPKYTINKLNNKVVFSETYLQHVGYKDNEEKYYLFDLSTTDRLLDEELSYTGIEDCFNEIDFMVCIKHLVTNKFELLDRGYIPTAQYLICQVIFNMSHNEYSLECDDVRFDIIGYLNTNLENCQFNKNKS